MWARSRELLVLLAVFALAHSEPANKTHAGAKKASDNFLYQYEDYESTDDQEEVLYNEDKPCPRDCICTVSQGYRIANCNRLEIGTQKFGDDITDLVIENADPKFPIMLDDFIFKNLGLHQVATIKIVNSTIGNVGPNAFHGLHELYAVNLSNNKIKNLHPDTFANNKKLLLLTLTNNPLKFPALGSEDYFLNASSVQELDVSYCNIQYITANTFKNMPGLMYLNLAGNTLSDMDRSTFSKLLDLEELDLSDNDIRSLPDDIFSENTELATLHIQRNPIDTVYGLQISDLLTLNAGQTKIKFVGPSMFNGMTYIASLNLSGNNIEKIHNQAFHKLVELNYLDLSYNDLDFMSSILIKENMELDIFKISNNPRLGHLPENGFECTAHEFNIYLFDASYCGLTEIYDNSLSTFTALSQVHLAGNMIKSISPKVFSKCQKLIEINLADNLLTTLDPKIFEQNKELGKLNLRGNPLKVFSSEVFTHTPALTWLDMSHTELTSLWADNKNHPVTLLKNLSYLNISHCRITEIKQNQLENSTKLRTLDISNNPLACSREFENLMTWLNSRKVTPNSDSASIANLSKDPKNEGETYSWEFLSHKVCGNALPHPIEPLNSPVSDEEIWERIDEDDNGNFDLKNTLDDGKIADDSKLDAVVDKDKAEKEAEDEDDESDDLADDDDDDADDEDDDEDEDDDASEDLDDAQDDVDLKVKLVEKPTKAKEPVVKKSEEKDKLKVNFKLLENDMYDDNLNQDIYIQASVSDYEHDRYAYLWPILIAVLGALVLLLAVGKAVAMVCNRRSRQVRYNSAIIAAMNQQNRTKKDCGLVYQQLTEDLAGPPTPKHSRYAPLHTVAVKASNLSYESSPFHHTNIVPEAV